MNGDTRQIITYGISSVLGVLIAVMLIVNISLTVSLKRDIEKASVLAANATPGGTEAVDSQKLYYTVTRGDGMLIIKDKNGAQVETVKCDTEHFTQADRELLDAGIRVNTEQELAAVIEDYAG